MLSLTSSPFAFAPAMAPAMAPSRAMPVMQTKEELATALNPAIGYCAPAALQHRCKRKEVWHGCSS